MEALADLILQVALVGEVDQRWLVHMEDKGRRVAADLGRIVDPELTAGPSGRGMLIKSLA